MNHRANEYPFCYALSIFIPHTTVTMLKLIAQQLIFSVILLARSWGQTPSFTTSSTAGNSLIEEDKQFENNVLSSILRIVDHKFDTLSTRLTTMERAINGLQFYNIRQFRSVSTKIQSTTGILERLGAQVNVFVVFCLFVFCLFVDVCFVVFYGVVFKLQ